MRDIKKLYEEIERKIERLKEKRKKLELKLKQEQAIAMRYAKEIAFCFSLYKKYRNGWELDFDGFLKCLTKSVCKRAKDKMKCLNERLTFVRKYYEGNHLLAKILRSIAEKLEEQKGS